MIKKTKVVATIGPATWDKSILQEMINNGMNVARINASFADYDELKRVSSLIRSLSSDVALMLDTKGHKIRISDFKNERVLKDDQKFSLYTKPIKDKIYLVTESNINLESQIPKDTNILIDDGLIILKVVDKKENEIICKVIKGGILKRGKTVNIPGIHIEFPEISKKDFEDISYAKELKFDFVAASFVRNVNDVKAVKKVLGESGIKVIAKIEDMEGVTNFDDILNEVNGIMIARGDLGVEIAAEKVPILQKIFIEKCNNIGKPVIVATQMLQSMIENITHTRAEVNDVANAILDGADAIMLSEETSTGKYPSESVSIMNKISLEIEKSVVTKIRPSSPLAKPTTNAIAKAVIDSCETLPIDKILVATATGTTAITIARFRPKQPIYAFTKDEFSKRKLSMSRGIISDILEISSSTRDTGVQSLVRTAKNNGHVSDSDLVIVVAGANIMGQGETNMFEINRVEQILNE
jgi:pyruvate kinase